MFNSHFPKKKSRGKWTQLLGSKILEERKTEPKQSEEQKRMEEGVKGKRNDRWDAAIANLTETSGNLESLQKILLKKAVFVDEDTYNKASLASHQSRTIKVSLSFSYRFPYQFLGLNYIFALPSPLNMLIG